MNWRRIKKPVAAMAAGAVLPVLPIAAGPATAEEHECVVREHTTPSLPGGFSSITVKLEMCVIRENGNERAAWIDWYGWRAIDGTMPPSKRFHHIVLKVRLERNNDVKKVTRCEFTRKANNHLALPDIQHPQELRCLPDSDFLSNSDGGWSADATLRYDIAWDDKGVYTKHFAGTPEIG